MENTELQNDAMNARTSLKSDLAGRLKSHHNRLVLLSMLMKDVIDTVEALPENVDGYQVVDAIFKNVPDFKFTLRLDEVSPDNVSFSYLIPILNKITTSKETE